MSRCLAFIVLILGVTGYCFAVKNPAATRPMPEPKQRVALVIGNSRYPTGLLKNPENDALTVAKTLSGLGFEVDYYANLDQQGMVEHIFNFYHHKAAKSALRLCPGGGFFLLRSCFRKRAWVERSTGPSFTNPPRVGEFLGRARPPCHAGLPANFAGPSSARAGSTL